MSAKHHPTMDEARRYYQARGYWDCMVQDGLRHMINQYGEKIEIIRSGVLSYTTTTIKTGENT